MRQRLAHWLFAHRGLVLLTGFLCWITFASLQPDFFLIGWDNYSSYFGGFEGLFRTLFSTWRSYRGIGVPGDSESTDIVRQALLLLLSPFVAEPLRDQFYIMGCLWIGVLAVYLLTVRLVRRYMGASDRVADAAAAFSAFVYAINLNTISTFYFPIITYITRYASVPLLVLMFDHILHEKPLRMRSIVGFMTAVLFSAGSFITATVFFTTSMLLGIYAVFQGNFKRVIVLLLLFVGLNAFWLTPFANYTREKSSSLRLAPVFIDTNEAQLNQAPQAYSLWKQLTLYPNFFNTRYTTVSDDKSTPLYPLTEYADSEQGQMVLGIFPVVALLGIGALLLAGKKYYRLLWIPATYLLFVILASQEQSPLGFIPAFLNKIPYFQVVFRFGDTKFHPYISFAGSLAVGMFIVLMMNSVRRVRRADVAVLVGGVALLVMVPLVSLYRPYMTGDFLPNFLMATLPEAYREMATVINADRSSGRVLHLPYDPNLYWRSHTWGYMGSAFFQYMLQKPYLDKTFEPASLETTDLFLELSDIIRDANQTVGEGLVLRADRLHAYLLKNNVRWVLFDESVSPEMRIRNMRYWGSYNTTDAAVLLAKLETDGKITKVKQAEINLASIGDTYATQLGQSPQQPLTSPRLALYRVGGSESGVSFAARAEHLDPKLSRTTSIAKDVPLLQSAQQSDALLYPLLHKDAVIKAENDGLVLDTPRDSLQIGGGSLKIASGSGSVVEVRMKKDGDAVLLRLYKVEAPAVGSQTFTTLVHEARMPGTFFSDPAVRDAAEYFSNWHVLENTRYGNVRLLIGDMILPVPAIEATEEHTIGSVLTMSPTVNVSVLRGRAPLSLDAKAFVVTDTPNCFGDRIGGYAYDLDTTTAGQFTLTSKNGSTCLVYPFTPANARHAEVRFRYRAEAIDDQADQPHGVQAIPGYVASLPKPNLLSLCIGKADGKCLNLHQMLSMEKDGTVILPTETDALGITHMRVGLVPIGSQTQKITVTEGELMYFDAVRTYTVAVPQGEYANNIVPENESTLITIPALLSPGSYYHGKHDGWYASNRPCETSGGYRTTRRLATGTLSYLSDCYNELSVPLSFDSGVARLWAVSYTLFSGKYPQFMLGDPFGHYVQQYLSLYEGYPTVPGMLSLQAPQQWYRPYAGDTVSRILQNTPPTWTYVLIPAAPELTDTRAKSYTLHQDSKNTGIFGVYDTRITEFPAAWQAMSIQSGDPQKRYAVPASFEYRELLPSLVEVRVKHAAAETGSNLLVHRAGYDRQWAAYADMRSVITGENPRSPVRCDGAFNCYELPSAVDRWYLFYTPERLAIIGWLVTILSAVIFAYSLLRLSRSSNE